MFRTPTFSFGLSQGVDVQKTWILSTKLPDFFFFFSTSPDLLCNITNIRFLKLPIRITFKKHWKNPLYAGSKNWPQPLSRVTSHISASCITVQHLHKSGMPSTKKHLHLMSANYNYFSLKGFTENANLLMSVTIKNGKLHLYRATSAKTQHLSALALTWSSSVCLCKLFAESCWASALSKLLVLSIQSLTFFRCSSYSSILLVA